MGGDSTDTRSAGRERRRIGARVAWCQYPPPQTPPRPWWRVVGRTVTITLVIVVYLLILWPIFVNAWTYWSGIITKENQVRKLDEVEQPTSCFNKAAPEEPIFVVRAKDPEAPDTVRTWANNARTRGTHEPEKIAEAFALAEQMDEYRRRVHPTAAERAAATETTAEA